MAPKVLPVAVDEVIEEPTCAAVDELRYGNDADDVCLAFLLERRLHEEGWESSFDGEVVGLISKGAFIRFGEEGFEKMVDRIAGIEKTLGIYDLVQFTPKL